MSDIVPHCHRRLLQIILFAGDPKVALAAIKIVEDSQIKQKATTQPILIKDSQVALIMQTVKELKG